MKKARKRLADLEGRLTRELPQAAKAEPDEAKPRDAVARLRAEIEVLQLEVAADKAQLVELINAVRKAETRTLLDSLREFPEMPMTAREAFETITKAESGDASAEERRTRIWAWAALLENKAKSGDRDAQKIQTILEEVEGRTAQAPNDAIPAAVTVVGGPTPVPDRPKPAGEAQKESAKLKKVLEAAEKRCAEIKAKNRDELQALLERKKKAFAGKLTELNEKRAELDRAEKPSGAVVQPVSDGPSASTETKWRQRLDRINRTA